MTTPPSRPDPRRNAWRDDLAAEALRGVVTAPRHVAGAVFQVVATAAGVRRWPRADAALDTEALYGECVTVYDFDNGWAWGQLARDGYVGYIPRGDLSADVTPVTHRISALGTHVYPRPDIKAPAKLRLSLNAEIAVTATDERFAELARGGYIATQHIVTRAAHAADFVAVAEKLLGSPYLWGGRTPLGIDCSGLVQLALEVAGCIAPRDSDMQAAELGAPLAVAPTLEGLQRGDLVCWRGHIGIMRDCRTVLHANAYHMAVASEPLANAVARISRDGEPPIGFRRLSGRAA